MRTPDSPAHHADHAHQPAAGRRVTVIGAGLVGLATAWELTNRGYAVTVVDPEPLSGASHWAAGMLAPTAEMQFKQDSLFPLMFASAARYPELVREIASLLDAPVGHWETGTFGVAGDAADREHLTDLLALQRTLDQTAEPIPTSQLRREEPAIAPGVAGAVHIPGDHQVDPRVFGQALIDALALRGVAFERRCGTAADLVPGTVLAAGLGAKDLLPGLPLRPVYGDILRLSVPADQRPLLSHVVRGFVNDRPVYLVPRQDGGLVLGATSREDGREAPQVGGVLDLLRDAARIVPAIRDCDVVEVGAGARPGTPDDLPLLGVDPGTGVVVSTGYFRHGILLTAIGAHLGAQLVDHTLGLGELTDQDRDLLAATNPWRFGEEN